jgi:hypothetical protein
MKNLILTGKDAETKKGVLVQDVIKVIQKVIGHPIGNNKAGFSPHTIPCFEFGTK